MNELALFAGGGGGLLASNLLGWDTVGAVEIEKNPREVLLQRQRDGMLDQFPIWDDVRTFDGKPWRGLVDVVSGGFPCQDISAAGKGAGLAGTRSGMWYEYLRIIGEARPRFAFIENSPMLRTRGLGTIIKGLDELGYDLRWGVLGAWHFGAPHKRDRMWILAHSNSHADSTDKGEAKNARGVPEKHRAERCSGMFDRAGVDTEVCANTNSTYKPRKRIEVRARPKHTDTHDSDGRGEWWKVEPRLGRVAHGMADQVDRLKAIGNGQVPIVAATVFEILRKTF